jgi:MinD superfamily P-loop ATPase
VKQLAVISGKGGTGKTSLAGAFAALSPGSVLADCDVDAANLHLLVCDGSDLTRSEPFFSGVKAKVDPDLCTGCGWCETACRFSAIRMTGMDGPGNEVLAVVDPMPCEGCGVCFEGCPARAVSLTENHAGELFVTPSRFGTLVHAGLNPGEGSSGKLVTKVRTMAKTIAKEKGSDLIIIDGSPGIGCPVIASLSGVDAVLIVTEPTLSGKSDLERVLELCTHFGVSSYVFINKYDLSEEMARVIQEVCRVQGIPVVGTLGFDPVFVSAMTAGKSVVEIDDGPTARQVRNSWSTIRDRL